LAPARDNGFESISSGETYNCSSCRCFVSSLNRVPKFSDFIFTPGIKKERCYKTICAAPRNPGDPPQIKVQIAYNPPAQNFTVNVWYDCPYLGGTVNAIQYGGQLECAPRAADTICAEGYVADDWPVFERVEPPSAKPGEQIKIYGNHFTPGMGVIIYEPCDDVVVVSDSLMRAKLASPEYFVDIKHLSFFENKDDIILYDLKNDRSSLSKDAFQVIVNFDWVFIKSVFLWIGQNVVYASVLIFLASLCVSCCAYGCCFSRNVNKHILKDDPDFYYSSDENYDADTYNGL